MSFSFSPYELKSKNRITQEEMFDFMCDMSQSMRDENIPIVNNIIRDFPGLENKDTIKYKIEKEKKEEIDQNPPE